MSIVNTRDRTISTKIVYYGPALGGKTTSLQVVHRRLDPESRVKLVSLKTDEERTLFFDFLPIDLGSIAGYKVRIQGFTVPGQVKYSLTRRYVLMGADAVVFVADSQAPRLEDNIESLLGLGENLTANGLDVNEIPLVMQYNKRDLEGTSPIEELETRLNFRKAPMFATSALEGRQVFEAFVSASRTMLDQVAARYGIGGQETGVGELVAQQLVARATSA